MVQALRIAIVTVSLLTIAALNQSSVEATEIDKPFTLENNSGQAITRIDMKRDGSNQPSWLMFQQLIQEGAVFNLFLVDAQCPANYTVRVQLTDGQLITSPTVNFCQQRVFSLKPTGFDASLTSLEPQAVGGPRQRTGSNPTLPSQTFEPVISAPPPPPSLLPVMFDNYHPDRPLAANALTNLNTVMSTKGFTPASCSAAPVVMITINDRYTACAAPTKAYPGGQYKMRVPNL